MFTCNLGSNNVIVSPFKIEGGSARSQSVKVSRQLSAQFLVPLGLTGDGSGLASLKRFGGSWAFPLARPPLSPRALPHSFHSGTQKEGLDCLCPCPPILNSTRNTSPQRVPFLQGLGDSHVTATGKTRKRTRWDVRELVTACCEVGGPCRGPGSHGEARDPETCCRWDGSLKRS